MNIHERNLNKRMNYVTTQLQLLLKKEIERNKQLDKERIEREAKDEKERIEREAKDEKERIRYELWFKAFDERLDRYTIAREESSKKVDRSFARLNKIVSDYGLSHGNEAEFSFKLAIKRQKLLCGGIQFNEMKANIKKVREYDIILINGSYVALVEVKRKASLRDVTKLVKEQAVSFRAEFPQYKDKILVCFLAAYVAVDKVVEKANQFGVGVLLQDGFDIQEVVPVLKEF